MTTIRIVLASVTLLTAVLTTVVTVAPQPLNARAMACGELPQPVRA